MQERGQTVLLNVYRSFLATCIIGFGISLFIECQLGSDPMSVFLDGVNRVSGWPIGWIDQVLNIVLLLIGYGCNKRYVGINTIINVLLIGICVELPHQLIQSLGLADSSLGVRLILVLVAQLAMATGLAWLQTFEKGMSNIDAILITIHDKTGIRYWLLRMGYDALFIIVGWLLGGTIGIGTIIAILTTGYFTEIIRKLIDRIKFRKEVRV